MTTNTSSKILAEADALDAQGHHDDAINVLARATQQGDQIAKTQLGKRLLVGDRSPYLPKEGAAFILESAQTGVPEAVSLVSVFQATGIFQEKNWQQALQTLSYAAQLGDTSAKEQLLLLTDNSDLMSDAEAIANEQDDFWQQIHDSIDLSPWLNQVEGSILSTDPLIKTFKQLLSVPICNWLINLSSQKLKPALVYDAENRRNYKSETRTNSIAEFNLVENKFLHFLIQQKMSSSCDVPMQQMEGTAILNYKPGEEISNHYDFVNPEMANYEQEINDHGQRIITFLIYLNDNYEGGETVFTKLGLTNKGSAGDAMYFVNALPDGSSDQRTEHAGRPTIAGEKWIISQFIRNREVKYIL